MPLRHAGPSRHVSPEGVRHPWLRRGAYPPWQRPWRAQRRTASRRCLPLAPVCNRLHPPNHGVTMWHHAELCGGPERQGRGTTPYGQHRAHRRAPWSGSCSVVACLLALVQRGLDRQLLDDADHPDGQTPETSAGALYGLVAPRRAVLRHIGSFHTARLWSGPATWNCGSMGCWLWHIPCRAPP